MQPEMNLRRSRPGTCLAVAAAAVAAPLWPALIPSSRAQDGSGKGAKQAVVVAGEQYEASGLHELLFGADYRDLWTTPVRVEVLDMGEFAGGLRPVRRVGGMQTKGLALGGADGRDYTFRGVDKDPSSILPPDLQGTLADRIVQDQIASGHPAGPLVAAPILEAAGVPHTWPRLVVMPDDPVLGEFRADFAGVLGTIEEYPQPASDRNPGFANASDIIGGEELWTRLRKSSRERVDDRAFLEARLVDLLLGDWDRHLKQWRWVRTPEEPAWRPLPEDRDQAFSRFEGLVLAIGRFNQPRFVRFDDEYPDIVGLTFNGWDVDRRLLVGLEKPVWDETAARLKERITDEVIEQAVSRLPEAYRRIDGPRLAAALKSRRDRLPEAADRFYRLLADRVSVEASDEPERAEVVRLEGGDVEVRIRPADDSGAPAGDPFFERRFRKDETSEVRLYLHGGSDRVVTSGPADGVVVRVVGGEGFDVLDDSAGGGTRFYDAGGNDRVVRGEGTRVDERPYVPPPANPKAPWIPPRDWGRKTVPILWLGGSPDVGAFLGAGVITEGYGFRRDPFADRQTVRAGYATGAKAFRADYEGEFRRISSGAYATLAARVSGIEVLRFHGFGNESSSEGPDDFFKVEQQQLSFEPSLTVPVGPLQLSFGPRVSFASTDQGTRRLVTVTRPYGIDDFGQVGAAATLRFDSRDVTAAPREGIHVWLTGRYYPELWNVETAFGSIHGEAATYLGGGGYLQPTIALRAGGKRVFGTYPFHEAAFIGGGANVRGFQPQRFAGDGSLYGNAELRVQLGRFFLLLPGDFGVFGLADAGRVYLEGETSDRWHTSVGGGFWFAYLDRSRTVSVAVARSEERTGLYVRAGFSF